MSKGNNISEKPTSLTPTKHDICEACLFELNDQNPYTKNECTLCLFNAQAVKTNSFKPKPGSKDIA